MSTSFFSWLDPSTLMLSPLRLSLPPLSVSLLVGAGWSRVLNPPSCVTQQSQRSHSCCCWMEREGAGMPEQRLFGAEQQLPRPRSTVKAFLDSLLTEEPFFRRLGGSGCRSMPGRSESRCLEAIHTPAHTACTLSVPHSSTHCMHTLAHTDRESPIQDNLGHCHQP